MSLGKTGGAAVATAFGLVIAMLVILGGVFSAQQEADTAGVCGAGSTSTVALVDGGAAADASGLVDQLVDGAAHGQLATQVSQTNQRTRHQHGHNSSSATSSPPPSTTSTLEGPLTVAGITLDSEQLGNAAAVVAAGQELEVPAKGQAIALMTAYGESGLRVLDHGDAAGPDSRGLFQQRDNGAWGTLEDRMDPRRSSLSFYRALLTVPSWQSMEPTLAAHAVQRNADPYYYEPYWDLGVGLLSKLTGSDAVAAALANGASNSCDQLAMVAGGAVVWPVPASMAGSDRRNYGGTGGLWASYHTGTDFSVPCGTPVYAATAGVVILDHSQAWAGPTLVKVSTGPGQLTTWYAHMQAVLVTDNQAVSAGQQIGLVGAEGNVTGCHLHFEVHPQGGTIYQDDINPSPWLEQHVGQQLTVPIVQTGDDTTGQPSEPGSDPDTEGADAFRVASFNALGDSHTAPGGNKCCKWADSATRTARMVDLFAAKGVQLVGLQEFQPPQQRVFTNLAGDSWQLYAQDDNAIAWRRDSFDLVSAATFPIPYFSGNERQMPVVVLRQRSTGSTFAVIDVHNPADARGPAAQWRAEAIRRERVAASAITAQLGLPMMLLGDFNDYEQAFCPVTADGLMTAAAGGNNPAGGPCNAPGTYTIDWLFGTGVTWSHYQLDHSTQGPISDHPYAGATADLQ